MRVFHARGHRFKISRVENIDDTLEELGQPTRSNTESPLCGLMCDETKQILIQKGTERSESSTLLHEMIHAVDPSLHEDRVRSLEDHLFPVLWMRGWRPFAIRNRR